MTRFISTLLGLVGFRSRRAVTRQFKGRRMTHDEAIQFRMKGGFAGEVNRTHPAGIEPVLIDATSAATIPSAYGQPVVIGSNNGVRKLAAGDTALTGIYGITVRPFPIQAPSAAVDFGGTQAEGGTITAGGAPPSAGAIDVLRSGYIMMPLNTGASSQTPAKGAAVFVWVSASAAGHVQGQLETAKTADTIPLTDAGSVAKFNGPPDANGLCEIAFNV